MNKPQSFIDKDRAATLLEKWAPVLDYSSDSVKAIGDDTTRLNTAILLENQEKWCIEEANTSGGALGSSAGLAGGAVGNSYPAGDQYATGDSRLPKVLIPMIRRTFPELISNEIVGVQPMSGPVGLAFALRYAYSSETLGTGIDGKPGEGGIGGSGARAGDYDGTVANKELGYQMLDTRFTGASGDALSGSTAAGWEFADEDRGVAEILSNFEITGNIPQVEVKFEKTAVEAGTRRLGARWSVELEQDLKNMNGIDVDAEITNAMSYEIKAEIDRECS